MRNELVTFILCASTSMGWVSHPVAAQECPQFYETDFEADPQWVTNDSTNIGWNSGAQTYHAWMSNCGSTYAYQLVDTNGDSFVLDCDVKVNSIQWSAGVTFGLFTSDLHASIDFIGLDFSVVDNGYGITIFDTEGGQGNAQNTWNTWTEGRWYRNRLIYDATANTLRLRTWDRESGQVVADMTLTNVGPLSPDLDYFGVSRVHMNCYNQNAVDFDLDNIVFAPLCPSSSIAELTGFTVATGSLISGSLQDLMSADEAEVHCRSGFGSTITDLHNMDMVIDALSSNNSPTSLNLKVRTRIDQAAGTLQVRLKNLAQNTWNTVGSFAVGTESQTFTVEGVDAANYVGSNGEIQVSVKEIVHVPFLAFRFDSWIDWVEIRVE